MFLPIVTIALAFGTVFVKWFTTVAETRKQARLAEVIEAHGNARQRLKKAVGAVSIADAEIAKLQRSIKTHQRKIPTLTQELKKLESEAKSQADMAQQKLALAEAMKNR